MFNQQRPVVIASRGSALALVQANQVLDQCRALFAEQRFDLRIYKTTGDKLQTAPPDLPGMAGTKGLFTKELEVALLNGEADLAVHSLKDLPTELPAGLKLGAVSRRADVRDVLICRSQLNQEGSPFRPSGDPQPRLAILDLPSGATIATSSTRRAAQLLAHRPDLKTVPIRGNVGTRLQKLADQSEIDGLILAAAGFERLGFRINSGGSIEGQGVPKGLIGVHLSVEEMLPCVGQAALGIEIREADPRLEAICAALNHPDTRACVLAERAFLRGMGGGCLSPVAALGEMNGTALRLRAVSFQGAQVRRGERSGPSDQALQLGAELAAELKSG